MSRPIRSSLARAAGLALLCLLSLPAMAASPWPQVEKPADASVYEVDAITFVNGMPMKMHGLVSPRALPALAAWYKSKLGEPVVENALGNKTVLGQARGDFFITIQLEPLARGTRAVVAVTRLKGPPDPHTDVEGANRKLLARLPAGTTVVSRLAAVDGPRDATHVVLSNNLDQGLNRDRVVRMLKEDGLRLEHEAEGNTDNATGTTLFFKGAGKEAMAVLARNRQGQTTIVLNTTTFLELK